MEYVIKTYNIDSQLLNPVLVMVGFFEKKQISFFPIPIWLRMEFAFCFVEVVMATGVFVKSARSVPHGVDI